MSAVESWPNCGSGVRVTPMDPSDPSALSLLPPAIAIVAAILTRQVHLSLFVGIWLGWTVTEGGDLFVELLREKVDLAFLVLVSVLGKELWP